MQENEAIAQAFTQAQPEFEVLVASTELERLKVPQAASLCSGDQAEFLRLWPHRHGTDGFFAALWVKK
jgi:16S rRNA (cytosine967-C5)-methyltransferase